MLAMGEKREEYGKEWEIAGSWALWQADQAKIAPTQ
jgi:hypothetical protein